MIDLLVKTGFGKGPEYCYEVSAVPQRGDQVIVPSEGDTNTFIYKEVHRIDHDLPNNKVIIFTR